jgi:hypothetical protein
MASSPLRQMLNKTTRGIFEYFIGYVLPKNYGLGKGVSSWESQPRNVRMLPPSTQIFTEKNAIYADESSISYA